ncbi:MAG: DsbA family protein [Myxococcota bacterium]
MDDARALFYFADPMCSWCWGFTPSIERIQSSFSEDLPCVLVLGGLRPGEAMPLDESTKSDIATHWEHVAEASGQPFDHAFFEREGFVYDTEPACRAVVTARALGRADEDESVGFRMLSATHRAFYAENRDVTDPEVLADVAESIGLDRAAFLSTFLSTNAREATYRDFIQSRSFGVDAFPTIVAASGDSATRLAHGFAPWSEIETRVRSWLSAL